jgi:hypothetical protein
MCEVPRAQVKLCACMHSHVRAGPSRMCVSDCFGVCECVCITVDVCETVYWTVCYACLHVWCVRVCVSGVRVWYGPGFALGPPPP